MADDKEKKVIPFKGPGTIDADALRQIADYMEAGEVESLAVGVVFKDGQIAHYHDWDPKAVDVWALLGVLSYLTHKIQIGIDIDNGEL